MADHPANIGGPAATKNTRLAVLLWVALATGILFLSFEAWFPTTQVYTSVDRYVYGTAARRLLAGEHMYRDFFESKPPLMALTYALPGLLAQGQEKSGNGMVILLVVTLFIEAALWLHFLKPGLFAGLATTLFLVIYPTLFPDFAWASTEHLSNVFVTLILILSWIGYRDGLLNPGRMFVMGAAVCIAFHYRQNCLVVGIIPVAVVLACRQPAQLKARWLGWFVAGGLAAWLVILGIVLRISDLPDYYYQVFVFPKKFAAQRGDLASRASSLLYQLHIANTVLLPFIFLSLLVPALFHTKRAFVILAAVTGIGYCCISPRPHAHYLINIFPFIVLFFFAGLDSNPATSRIKGWICLVALTLVFYVYWQFPLWKANPPLATMDGAVQAVDRIAHPGDTLYLCCESKAEYIRLCADPLPGNKYAFGWEIDSNAGMVADTAQAIFDDYRRKPPTILVFEDTLIHYIGFPPSEHPPESRHFNDLAKSYYPASPKANADSLQFIRLGRQILTEHHYEVVWNDSHFYVLVLKK